MGNKLKYIAAAVVVIMLGVVCFKKFFPSEGDPDVTGIQAEFIGEIAPGGSYNRSMFKVQGVTPAGRLVELKEYSVYDPSVEVEEGEERPPLRAAAHGSTCEVVVKAQGYEDTVTVEITREAVGKKDIGYPDASSATVTCYKNGDLEFTGKGTIMNFAGSVPWSKNKYSHVYIDEALELETMDSWFAGNANLVYCDPIPKTVKTMRRTFANCTSLEKTPDYFQCSELQIMNATFSGCKSLKQVDVIPVNVASLQYTFEACSSLQDPASLDKTSHLTNITGLYSGCTMLREVTAIPETVITMDKAYKNCVNIKEPARFPMNVQTISEAYAGCTGLNVGTTIPETVTNMTRCYSGCSTLTGSLEINSDTSNFSGFLQSATTNGDKLEIFGNSGNLLAIQKDSGNSNISLADPVAAALQNERLNREKALKKGGYI